MPINGFPDEILLRILSYCGPEVFGLIIPKVCERWKRLSTDVTLWKTLCYCVDRIADIWRVEQVRCAALLGFRANVNLGIMAEVSRKCLSTIWLVTDAFILLTVHTIIHLSLICFPLHPHSTAGKTVVYSSVILCWLELPSFVLCLMSPLVITTKYIQLVTVLVSSPSAMMFMFSTVLITVVFFMFKFIPALSLVCLTHFISSAMSSLFSAVSRISFAWGNGAMVQLFVYCVTSAVLCDGVEIEVSCFTCP
jgi:hypothetical protein